MSLYCLGERDAGLNNHNANLVISIVYTASFSYVCNEVRIYPRVDGNVKVAVYDNTDSLVASNTSGTACTADKWNTIPISDVDVVSGQSYRIAVIADTSGTISSVASTGGNADYITGLSYSSWSPPSTYPGGTPSTYRYCFALFSTNGYVFGEDDDGVNGYPGGISFGRQFTASTNGAVDKLLIHSTASGNVKAALYSDDGGSPGEPNSLIVANDTGVAVVPGWNSVPVSETPIVSGTKYWIVAIGDTSGAISRVGDASVVAELVSGLTYATYTAPSTWYGSSTTSTLDMAYAAYGPLTAEYEDVISSFSGVGSFKSLSGYRSLSSSIGTFSGVGSFKSLSAEQSADATIGTFSGKGSFSSLDGVAHYNAVIGKFSGLGSFKALRIADQYSSTIRKFSGRSSFNALRIADQYESTIGSFSGRGSFNALRISDHYDSTIGAFHGTGKFYPLRRVLTFPVMSPNARSNCYHAEIRRGCTLADTFVSLEKVESNGGTVSGGCSFDRFSGMTTDGYGRISYPADGGITDGSIVLAFKATEPGMIAGTEYLSAGIPGDGYCIWADEDGIYASHSDGATIATECEIEGEYLDDEWHVVTYVIELSSNIHTLYCDDESDSQSTALSGPIGASALIRIGGYLHDNIVGSIRSFRLYNGTALAEGDHNAYAP